MQSIKRPIGVWIILVLHAASLVQILQLFWLIYNKRMPVSSTTAEYLQHSDALTRSLTVIGLILSVAFLVALFRMRRVAVTIFTTNIVLGVFSFLWNISYVWNILFKNHSSSYTATSVVGVVVSLALLGVIYLYLRALVRVGKLT